MDKFIKVIEEKTKAYGVSKLVEDIGANNGGGMDSSQMDSEMPAPEPDLNASPDPETGAGTEKPVYDKPYQDLANILYQALRTNFEDLEQSAQRKILAIRPEDIKSDEQGVSLFKTVESVLNENQGPESDVISSEYGPGSTV